jgi:hypothetical protein
LSNVNKSSTSPLAFLNVTPLSSNESMDETSIPPMKSSLKPWMALTETSALTGSSSAAFTVNVPPAQSIMAATPDAIMRVSAVFRRMLFLL